jgi:protein O-mannosyl-transferase
VKKAQAKRPVPPDAQQPEAGTAWAARLSHPKWICALLAAATLLVYLPTAWNGFVNYDDSDYVTENVHIKSGLNWETVVWAFKTGHASNWHPLTWLSHSLDWQLFGLAPGAMHLVSLGLHVANTLLLFLVLRRLTGALGRSALVAALFALHPLHVESVAWVSERKDVLSTCFFLLTLGAYAKYVEALRAEPPGARLTLHVSRFYLLSLVFFALGLMSKPMLVTTPFVLLLLDYWPLRRMQQAEGGTQTDLSQASVSFSARCSAILLLEKVPFFLLSAASSVATFLVQRKGGAVSTALTVGERIANAVVSYARYVRKMVWPNDLSVLYPHPGHWPWWQILAAAVLLITVSVSAVVWWRRRPYLIVGWLWFLGTLVPVIGLVQVGIQPMADRYTYVPMIGLFVMLVWGLGDLAAERVAQPWRGRALAGATMLALAACGVATFRQVQIWRDSETLFSRAVRVTTRNYLAHNNLGFYFSGKGRMAEAMEQYQLSLKIKPDYEDALNNLGYALAGQRKFAEAIPLYEAALRVRPRHAEVHNNLGNALSETGKIDDAISHYLVALEQNPEHADAHNNLGIALAMKGKLDEAVDHFHLAIRYKPNYASAHSNLGNALAVQHKLADAIKEYQESLRLKPEDPQAHNNLGNAFMEQGRVDEAVGHYREALRLNPENNPEAHYNLGLALVRQGKRDDAKQQLSEALRARPDYPEARRQLEILSAPPR